MSCCGKVRSFVTAGITLLFMVPGALAQRSPVPEEIPALIRSGRVDEAREMIREFRRREPDNALAIFYLARIESDRNLARALYKEVERLADPDLAAEATLARAEMHIEEEDYLGAEPLLVRVVTVRPSGKPYADALYRLGMIRLRAGKTDDALLQFQKSRDTQPDGFGKTLAAAGMMECYVAQKDWNRVLDASREVLESPDDTGALTPRVLEAVAQAWRELGNQDNADKFTQRLLSNFPRSYQAYALRKHADSILEGGAPPSGRQQAAGEGVPAENGSESLRDGGQGSPENADFAKGGFAVQAGAFTDRVNALKIYNRLKDSGFSTRVDMKTVGDRHFYLVRVGPFPSRDQADAMAVKVSRVAGSSATVVMVE